ncbi:DUF692 family multinuclear iron-containing protein [Salipiger sp. PrR002]|uniref:MNIO family bufferin maturase n=1 Tax=Salipiger sp. PrR002 TaxID=2706489 RepID=UPI0013B80FEC|nr:DUF692 domain-containing protein [Salipiger sp. PrR002]NDW02431.1 DUF692 domain-containing protein [Salipiger sp. PrR002]NDW59548.1 DUF692 domain-containing protein [Salipiger sp. PrR004]
MHPTHLPNTAGIGFKSQHFDDLASPGAVSWLEIHAENYMVDGGPRLAMLDDLRARFPISVHGVGLSIGGAEPLDRAHLARLRRLIDRVRPAQFSEHLAWSTHEGTYFSDLLPLPYTEATLARVAAHVEEVQQSLGLRMLLENPSSYAVFAESTMSETDFLAQVARRTGCGLLLDINNVFISASNLGTSAAAYLADYPVEEVGEIHLAGYAEEDDGQGAPLLIDTHGAPVADPVWALYADVIARIGSRPTLIEWDNDVPDFATLETEAARASQVMARRRAA